jgi:hypothetical protein
MITKNQIDKIETLAKQQNNGRGIICVGYIVKWLRQNDIIMARRIFETDGDKITQYPELYILIEDTIGCRTHGKELCDNWLCKTIYDDLSRKAALTQLEKKEFKDEN